LLKCKTYVLPHTYHKMSELCHCVPSFSESYNKEEKTVGQLAAEYEVHSNMLYRWREQALAGLPSLFSDQAAQELAEKEVEWQQEREALYAEIGRLTTQVRWLGKKSRAELK